MTQYIKCDGCDQEIKSFPFMILERGLEEFGRQHSFDACSPQCLHVIAKRILAAHEQERTTPPR